MSNWAVVRGDEVLTDDLAWNPGYLSVVLRNFGVNASLQTVEPSKPHPVGNVILLPVAAKPETPEGKEIESERLVVAEDRQSVVYDITYIDEE